MTLFSSPAVTIVFTGFFKTKLMSFSKTSSLVYSYNILKVSQIPASTFFLKISSYKKGVSFFTVMKTTPLQLTVTNSMIWGTLPLKDPGIGIGTVSPS